MWASGAQYTEVRRPKVRILLDVRAILAVYFLAKRKYRTIPFVKRVKTPVSVVVFFPVFGHSVGTNRVSTRGAPRRKPGANEKRGAVPFESRSARGGMEKTGRKRPVFR